MAATIEGTVTRTNGNGFQIAEQQGSLNISKYAPAGEAEMPAVGEHVRLTLDKAGYVRKVEELSTPAPVTMPGTAPAASAGMQIGDKDRVIVRESRVKAAVEIPAAGGKVVDLAEVLDVAEVLEQWVYRAA